MKPNNELLNLNDKTAIVTGGAKGIGFGISYRLAEAGAKVVIADLDEQAGKDAVNDLNEKGWQASFVRTDVSSEEDVRRVVDAAVEQFGSLDIMVHNAGIYPQNPISSMKLEDFNKVLHVNLSSTFLTTKYASEAMKKAEKGGRIINISSVDALHPSMVGLAHYDASKHGMWGFTKNAALELTEHGITVNAVAPGGIQTPGVAALQPAGDVDLEVMKKNVDAFMAKIPMHRMGEPDEIGKVVLFVASDMSSYMTGEQIVVDGGALLA